MYRCICSHHCPGTTSTSKTGFMARHEMKVLPEMLDAEDVGDSFNGLKVREVLTASNVPGQVAIEGL